MYVLCYEDSDERSKAEVNICPAPTRIQNGSARHLLLLRYLCNRSASTQNLVYVNDIMKTHSVITRLRDLHFKYIFLVLLKDIVYDTIMTVWGRFCFSMLFHLLFICQRCHQLSRVE